MHLCFVVISVLLSIQCRHYANKQNINSCVDQIEQAFCPQLKDIVADIQEVCMADLTQFSFF